MIDLLRRHSLVLVLAVWSASEPFALHGQRPWREALGGVLVALALLGRRRAPVLAGTATLAAVLAQLALEAVAPGAVGSALCVIVAGYVLGVAPALRGRWPVPGGLAVLTFLGGSVVLAALDVGDFAFVTTQTQIFLVGLAAGGLGLGFALRDRTARAVALRGRVEALEQRVAERLAAAAECERRWIAGHLEALVEQVSRHVPALEAAGDDPRAAGLALGDAERQARDAVGRLGWLLGVLRDDGRPAPSAPAPRSSPRRPARLLALVVPCVLIAVYGTAEQLLLPERPAPLLPGVVVEPAAYPLAVVLVLCWLTPLALVLRRRAPLVAIALVGALLVARTAADDLSSLTWSQHFLGIGLAFVAGAYARTTRAAAGGLALAALTSVLCWLFEEITMTGTEYAYLAALLAGVWIVGRSVRVQLREAEEMRAGLAELDARRAELETEVVRLERRRVAREVHDLVGHGLSLVSVHAAVSARRLERGEGRVRETVREVRDLAAATERELVTLLDLLRDPLGRERRGTATADLAAVRALVATARRHGHAVELALPDLGVTPEESATIADVVREGLTNVRKHAGPVPTEVVVRPVAGAEATLEVLVVNTPGSPTLGTGSSVGLRGLAERLGDLGGELEAGPTRTGGWRLRCSLPCSSTEQAASAPGALAATGDHPGPPFG